MSLQDRNKILVLSRNNSGKTVSIKIFKNVTFLNIKHVQKLVSLNSARSGYISIIGSVIVI
jgi:hypothetical protein